MTDLHEATAREFANGVATGFVLGALAVTLFLAVLLAMAMSEVEP